ncbi:myb-like protein A [Panonychus citri]|uniref:myb-like protein A n=1 Tax=Panonychus citri TaxID=50023 RepID=UPI0023079CF6|nr:myb-like protein A [Panonychus citri]
MATPPKVALMENTMVHSVDERKGCRSLLCDASGIIIAEMVYRCMVCYSIHDFIGDVSKHYHTVHMNDGDEETGDMTNEEDKDQSNRNSNNNNNNNNNKRNSNHVHNQNNNNSNSNNIDNNNNNNNYLSDHSNNCDESWEIDEKFKSNSQPHVKLNCTQSNANESHSNSPNASESCTRSGSIRCPVCSNVRCYTTLQRRYGQFTCVACYRFFKEFFLKPTRFYCPSLGQCPLDVKSKCKACWIYACTKIYSVDGRRKTILEENAPLKSHENETVSSSPCPSVITNYHNENNKSTKSSHNTVNTIRYSKSIDEQSTSITSNPKDSNSFGNNISNNQSTTSGSPSDLNPTGVSKTSPIYVFNCSRGDNYPNNNSELAGLSALNMMNILSCEEAVPDCDELLEDIAEDYSSIDSQLNHFPPQKMIKLGDAPDNNNNNLISNCFTDQFDGQFPSQLQPQAQTAITSTTTGPFSTVKDDPTNEKSTIPIITGTPISVIKTKPDRRSKVRVKNWCCLKCANCLADDCGKCINCLDRPKFGGPFVRKQRCVNKKCLEKIQPDQPK